MHIAREIYVELPRSQEQARLSYLASAILTSDMRDVCFPIPNQVISKGKLIQSQPILRWKELLNMLPV
jgi:hypothetical protein